MSSPRILFVTRYHWSRFVGGAELQCWMLATELARRGWDVHYASEMNAVPNPPVLDGVTLHGLPEDASFPAFNRLPLGKLMAKLQPDVIFNQVHDAYMRDSMIEAPGDSLTVWWLAADAEGRFLRGLKQIYQAGGLRAIIRRLPRFVIMCSGFARARRRAKLILEQYPGQSVGIEGIQGRVALLHNSHPPVPDGEVQKHDGKPRIFWIASIKKWKRPELFWELARRCDDLDADFVMAGLVQQPSYEPRLREALQTTPNLSWIGHVDHTQVGAQFSKAHLLICTSISEGFSNTFIEAWMHGVPVISLAVDSGDYLQKKGLGVFAHNSMEEMEKSIRDLINHPERRRKLGEHARKVAVEDFLLQNNIDRLEKMFADRGIQLPQSTA